MQAREAVGDPIRLVTPFARFSLSSRQAIALLSPVSLDREPELRAHAFIVAKPSIPLDDRPRTLEELLHNLAYMPNRLERGVVRLLLAMERKKVSGSSA